MHNDLLLEVLASDEVDVLKEALSKGERPPARLLAASSGQLLSTLSVAAEKKARRCFEFLLNAGIENCGVSPLPAILRSLGEDDFFMAISKGWKVEGQGEVVDTLTECALAAAAIGSSRATSYLLELEADQSPDPQSRPGLLASINSLATSLNDAALAHPKITKSLFHKIDFKVRVAAAKVALLLRDELKLRALYAAGLSVLEIEAVSVSGESTSRLQASYSAYLASQSELSPAVKTRARL